MYNAHYVARVAADMLNAAEADRDAAMDKLQNVVTEWQAGRAKVRPWRGDVPTADELVPLLDTLDADYLTGRRESTSPVVIELVAAWHTTEVHGYASHTNHDIRVVLFQYEHYSYYHERAMTTSITLIQMIWGGLYGGEGEAGFDIYQVSRALDAAQAKEMVDRIREGLPQLVGSGTL